MMKKEKIWNIFLAAAIVAVIGFFMWFAATTSSKAQAIEAVSSQLIRVYETSLPYEDFSNETRKEIRICFLGNVHEYDMGIDDLFRLAFADDIRFNKVILLIAYLNLQRNQLVFFYIWEGWLLQIKPAI